MKRRTNNESGAIAIEAVLGITVFLMTICTLLFISYLVRVEAKVQYAVDQTAKEISSYYYVIDNVGLSPLLSEQGHEKIEESQEKINKVLNGVMEFTAASDDFVSGIDIDLNDIGKTIESGKNSANDAVNMYNKAKDVYDGLKSVAENPKEVLTAILYTFAHSFKNPVMMPFLCKMILPKYIGENTKQQKAFFEMTGMKNGIDDINFLHSTLLEDGRTVTVTAIYKINMKKLSFGLLNIDLVFCNTGSTAAWLKPDGQYTLSLAKAYAKTHPNEKKEDAEDKKKTTGKKD